MPLTVDGSFIYLIFRRQGWLLDLRCVNLFPWEVLSLFSSSGIYRKRILAFSLSFPTEKLLFCLISYSNDCLLSSEKHSFLVACDLASNPLFSWLLAEDCLEVEFVSGSKIAFFLNIRRWCIILIINQTLSKILKIFTECDCSDMQTNLQCDLWAWSTLPLGH